MIVVKRPILVVCAAYRRKIPCFLRACIFFNPAGKKLQAEPIKDGIFIIIGKYLRKYDFFPPHPKFSSMGGDPRPEAPVVCLPRSSGSGTDRIGNKPGIVPAVSDNIAHNRRAYIGFSRGGEQKYGFNLRQLTVCVGDGLFKFKIGRVP